MTTIQIRTTVSAEAAMAAGLIEHGLLLVAPTTAEVSALTAEQREALSRYVGSQNRQGRG